MDAPTATPPPADDPKVTRILGAPIPAPALPKRIDKYEVLSLLGSGGMGAVYLALDPDLDRQVAIKLVRPELVGSGDYLDRILREARLCARLNHPNIVTIHQVGRHSDVPYLVLEYVDGRSLLELLRTAPPIRLSEALDLIAQCCLGLQAAAKKHIVHRDIKPANIMISRSGEAKVMDFGLSKSVSPESMTVSGMLMGTPDYMAPEQAQQLAVDHRADIYALGITLFHCATGYLPFRASSAMSTLMNHQTKPLPEDAKLKAIADGRLWNLIYHMTAKAPQERLDSYDTIRTELLAIRDRMDLSKSGDVYTGELADMGSPTPATHPRTPVVSKAMPGGSGRKMPISPPIATFLALLAVGAIGGAYYFRNDPIPFLNSRTPPPPIVAPEPVTEEPVAPPTVPVISGFTLRSRGSAGSLRDIIVGLQSSGMNVVLDERLNPVVYTASYSFDSASPEQVLSVAALACNLDNTKDDQIWYISTAGAPSVQKVITHRGGIDTSTLPSVNLSTVAGNVTLREACEAFRRDGKIDYLIMPRELAETVLPPVGLTASPLPTVLELLKKQGAPFEWTVSGGILLLVPNWTNPGASSQ